MKKLKRNLEKTILVLLSIFLFSACNNDDDDNKENAAPCDYVFVNATIDNTTLEVGTPQTIKFAITKANMETCNTAYKMSYKVKLNGQDTTDGIFTYNNVVQVQETPFAITAVNFEGSFVSSQVGGIYEITFTIENTEAAITTQTKVVTLNYTYPPIVLTPILETSSVYAKQTAENKYTITGGGELGDYSIEINPNNVADLGATLQINGNDAAFGERTTITNEFTILLIPNEVGNTQFTARIEKNGIALNVVIDLESKMPRFDFDVQSTPITSGGTLTQYSYLNYTNMVLVDGYNEHIKYTLVPHSTGATVFTPTAFNNIDGVPLPIVLRGFKYNSLLISGETLSITITNEFGYSVTKNL